MDFFESLKIYTHEGLIVKFSGLENSLDLLELDKEHPILMKKFSGLNKRLLHRFIVLRILTCIDYL